MRVFITPTVGFDDDMRRNFIKLIVWMTLIAAVPVATLDFLLVQGSSPAWMLIRIMPLLPMIILAVILSYTLPVEKLYWCIYIQLIGALTAATAVPYLVDNPISSEYFPLVALMALPVCCALPLYPKPMIGCIIAIGLCVNSIYFALLYERIGMTPGWYIFNAIYLSLVFLIFALRKVFDDMGFTMNDQRQRIDELTETNALLNITLNENRFGLASFNDQGDLKLERGENLQRLFLSSNHKKNNRLSNLGQLKELFKTQYNLDFETLIQDFQEIEIDSKHYIIHAYEIEGLTIVSHMEVTQLREVEAELRARQKLALIGEITSGVAHNYNNMLAIALSNLEASLDKLPRNIRKEYIDPSIDAIEQSSEISRKLLAMSGQSNLKMEVFDISQTLRSMSGIFRSALSYDIPFEVDTTTPYFVKTDRQEFESAILNLIINARNAVDPRKGRIRINTRPYGKYVIVRVKDNGHGIDKSIQDKVFDPFFSTKSSANSAGLGLSTIRGFVEQSHGFITLESSPMGTIFDLYFPLHEAQGSHVVEPEQKARFTHIAKEPCNIFLVDDNPQVAQSFERLFCALDYPCLAVTSARKALDIFKMSNDNFTHAFLDYSMPEIDGIELGVQLKSIDPTLELILITGDANASRVKDAREAGFSHVLLKPINTKALLSLLEGDQQDDGSTQAISA